MSNSLLNSEGSDSSPTKPSFLYSLRSAGSVFGLNGKLETACVKSVSGEPGMLKPKHIETIVEIVSMQPADFEKVLFAYDALTNWQEKKIVSIKILIAVLVLFQRLPDIAGRYADSISILVSKIRNLWVDREPLMQSVSLFLKNKVGLLNYAAYTLFFDSHTTAASGITMAGIDDEERCTVVSAMVSCQDSLINLLKSLKALESAGSSSIDVSAMVTYSALVPVLMSESSSFFSACTSLLRYISTHPEAYSPVVIDALEEQYDRQFAQLQFIFSSLSTAASAEGTPPIYFPKINALLMERTATKSK